MGEKGQSWVVEPHRMNRMVSKTGFLEPQGLILFS